MDINRMLQNHGNKP